MHPIAPALPPTAAKEPHSITAHGQSRSDAYFWMRLSEEQRNAKVPDAHTQRVIDHLNAENDYSDAMMAPISELKDALYLEMKARIKETDMSVPYRENGYWYNFKYEEGKEYPIHMRGKALADGGAPPELEELLDENKLAVGHTYFDLDDLEVSPDNSLMVYSQDVVGRRQYEIRFRDIVTGADLPDVITNTSGGGAFADDRTFFYARKDRTLRSYKIYRHILGTDPKSDVVVYHEKDPAYSCDVYRSRSERFVVISTESTMSSEEWLLRTDDPLGEFRVFAAREEEHEYSAQHVPGIASEGTPAPGKFYIVTNWNAQNFRLMECAENATDKASWKEVIPHRADVMLEDVDLFKGHMVISERREGLVHLLIRDLVTGAQREIGFNDPAYVAYSGTNPEWNSTSFRYGYASLTTPSSVFEQDLVTGATTLLKQQEVVGDFDPDNYRSERIEATATDGARIPISLVHHKNTPLDGKAPLLLYGYGSYGINVEPSFSSGRLSLLDRGFVFAIAHIRGGEELGRAWYENGRMEHKQNTFTDFIACAEHLKAEGYSDPGRLYCMGGSAGGLLVGAVLNLRPDLWNAAVAEVPFVDVVTTMLDDTIPLTTGEYDEWGDPNEKEAYERMLSYSPYDNITDQVYPALLVTTGYHDSQVQYWEPAKWVARLREHQKGSAPILMHTNMEAGHGGASGRFERLKEVARIYAFLMQRAGLT